MTQTLTSKKSISQSQIYSGNTQAHMRHTHTSVAFCGCRHLKKGKPDIPLHSHDIHGELREKEIQKQ